MWKGRPIRVAHYILIKVLMARRLWTAVNQALRGHGNQHRILCNKTINHNLWEKKHSMIKSNLIHSVYQFSSIEGTRATSFSRESLYPEPNKFSAESYQTLKIRIPQIINQNKN